MARARLLGADAPLDRPRQKSGPGGAALPTCEGETGAGALANWCDDQLRYVAEALPDVAPTEALLWETTARIGQYVDNAFDEFIEELNDKQSITVSELNKGEVAKAWRECGTDASRVLQLKCLLDTDVRRSGGPTGGPVQPRAEPPRWTACERTARHFVAPRAVGWSWLAGNSCSS